MFSEAVTVSRSCLWQMTLDHYLNAYNCFKVVVVFTSLPGHGGGALAVLNVLLIC